MRIAAAVAFSIVIAAFNDLLTLAVSLAIAACVTLLTGRRALEVVKRLVPVNLFALFLIVVLPWTCGESPLVTFASLVYSEEGFFLALRIAVKANAIVLWIVVLLGSVDITTLGHALRWWGVPEKLTHLLLFTFRYVDVLHREYGRLKTAMRVRGFQPRVSAHTYRSYGYLVGMLLVRSLDRADRIAAAMKCRGFRGQLYLLHRFAFSVRDGYFAAAATLIVVVLAMLEWT
jgi:cobalt/nickel transport system permease protein